jgi:alkaline phosphatase D
MTSFAVDRRTILKAGALGLGLAAVPGLAAVLNARGFTHAVASGEPGARSVMLWTRYVPPAGGNGRLSWQVAADAGFGRVVARGEAEASEAHDFCVKPIAEGLQPGRWYYYRFRDAAGHVSPVGRTRTLPEGPVGRFALGLFSCANLPFGWFNAYGHAAARRDLDLVVHVGDYLYEYQAGHYPDPGEETPGRLLDPPTELVHLADYRLRYACYRADPDLQALHRLFPMVAMWDDHESANDSWQGGAQNHQPQTEGPWEARKAAAMQAYREWLPVSEAPWAAYEIGDLATLIRPEERLLARTRQLNLAALLHDVPDRDAALARLRDGAWRDPAHTLMGAEQEAWLAAALRRSVGRGARWQVLAQQVVMGSLKMPPAARDWLGTGVDGRTRTGLLNGLDAAGAGLPFNFDSWDGYPAARARLLRSALDANAELVVLSGDSHNAWAFDLDLDGAPAGIELAGQSVSSSGYESELPHVAPAALARAVVAGNPQLKWAETSRRGYATLTLTPQRADAEWLFLDTVRRRSTRLAARHAMSAARGARRYG